MIKRKKNDRGGWGELRNAVTQFRIQWSRGAFLKIALEQNLKGWGMRHVNIRWKNVPGRGNICAGESMPGTFEQHWRGQLAGAGWAEESNRESSPKGSGQVLRDIMQALLNFIGDGAFLLIYLLSAYVYNSAYFVNEINLIYHYYFLYEINHSIILTFRKIHTHTYINILISHLWWKYLPVISIRRCPIKVFTCL